MFLKQWQPNKNGNEQNLPEQTLKNVSSSLNMLGGVFLLIAAPIRSATNKKVGLFWGWG